MLQDNYITTPIITARPSTKPKLITRGGNTDECPSEEKTAGELERLFALAVPVQPTVRVTVVTTTGVTSPAAEA